MMEIDTLAKIVLMVGFVIALPVSVTGFIRTFRAKTVSENIKAHAMFTLPILSLFLFALVTGQIDFPDFDTGTLEKPPDPVESLKNLKPLQIVSISCAFGIWFIGNTILWRSHWKRTNKKWTTLMNPFAPPFAEFNSKEWLIFACLIAATFGFAFVGIAAGK